MSAQQYGMDPNQFAQAIDSQGQIGSMVQEVARRQGARGRSEQATVTDTSGNAVDLNALVPEAEDAEADGATGLLPRTSRLSRTWSRRPTPRPEPPPLIPCVRVFRCYSDGKRGRKRLGPEVVPRRNMTS